MSNRNVNVKLSVFVLFLVLAISSCMKTDMPEPTSYTAEREAGMIKDWKAGMKKGKIAYDSTASKIYYISDTTKIGTGAKVKAGDIVTVKYTGLFLDGTIFDASAYHSLQGTMTYIHKTDRMISGWEEGIELMNKGASFVFLFPSSLAYGSSGSDAIPPYTPLLFVIEVVDIK